MNIERQLCSQDNVLMSSYEAWNNENSMNVSRYIDLAQSFL